MRCVDARRLPGFLLIVLTAIGGLPVLLKPLPHEASAQSSPDARAGIVFRCRVPETANSPFLIRIGTINTGDQAVTVTLDEAELSADASVELKSLFPVEIPAHSVDAETWDLPMIGHTVDGPADVATEIASHGSWQQQTWPVSAETYRSFDSPAAVAYDEGFKTWTSGPEGLVDCNDSPQLPAELRVVVVDCASDPGALDPVAAWNGVFVDDQDVTHDDCAADTSARQFEAEDVTDDTHQFDRGLIATDNTGHSDDDAVAPLVRSDRQVQLTEYQAPTDDPWQPLSGPWRGQASGCATYVGGPDVLNHLACYAVVVYVPRPGCPSGPQQLIASGVDWEVEDYTTDPGTFDGTELDLIDSAFSAMNTQDVCVVSQPTLLPGSFQLSARLQLRGVDKEAWIWLEDPVDNSLLYGLWFSGTEISSSYAPNGAYEIWGPWAGYAGGLGGFDADEDVVATLSYDAATGELDGTFAQGERTETLSTTDDIDPPFERSGVFAVSVSGGSWLYPPSGAVSSTYDLTFENLAGGGARAAARPARAEPPAPVCWVPNSAGSHLPRGVQAPPLLATAQAEAGGAGTPTAGCPPAPPVPGPGEGSPAAGTETPVSPVAATSTPSPTAIATETATPSSTPTAAPVRNKAVKETFDDAGADGIPTQWSADAGNAPTVSFRTADGELTVAGDGAARLVRDGRVFDAPDVQTRLRFDRPGGQAGVLLAWTDPGDWVAAVADDASDRLAVWEAAGGQVREVVGTEPGSVPIEVGRDYWLRAQAGTDRAGRTWATLLWSTDGKRFRSAGYATGLANLSGGVGVIANDGSGLAFDDFAARRSAATKPVKPSLGQPAKPTSTATPATEPATWEAAGPTEVSQPTDTATPEPTQPSAPTATTEPTEAPTSAPTITPTEQAAG